MPNDHVCVGVRRAGESAMLSVDPWVVPQPGDVVVADVGGTGAVVVGVLIERGRQCVIQAETGRRFAVEREAVLGVVVDVALDLRAGRGRRAAQTV